MEWRVDLNLCRPDTDRLHIKTRAMNNDFKRKQRNEPFQTHKLLRTKREKKGTRGQLRWKIGS